MSNSISSSSAPHSSIQPFTSGSHEKEPVSGAILLGKNGSEKVSVGQTTSSPISSSFLSRAWRYFFGGTKGNSHSSEATISFSTTSPVDQNIAKSDQTARNNAAARSWLKFSIPSFAWPSFSFSKIFTSSNTAKIETLTNKLDSAIKTLSTAVTEDNINTKGLYPTFQQHAEAVLTAAANLEQALASSSQRNLRLSDKIENARNQATRIIDTINPRLPLMRHKPTKESDLIFYNSLVKKYGQIVAQNAFTQTMIMKANNASDPNSGLTNTEREDIEVKAGVLFNLNSL